MTFTIGADVEVFAKNKDGHHVSLCGLIGGTKEKPKQLDNFPLGFCVQEDNVSLEWNIPATSRRNSFIDSIYAINLAVNHIVKTLDLQVSDHVAVSFDKQELTHPNALVFGCEPDYDAWKLIENSKPQCNDVTLRTAGGHIHVGTDRDMVEVIRNMDLLLGVPSVILDTSPGSAKRRELYGKAGAMRPKPYGCEYRVLSNYWTKSHDLITWVYNQTRLATEFKHNFTKEVRDSIINCINTGDKQIAGHLIETFGIKLP